MLNFSHTPQKSLGKVPQSVHTRSRRCPMLHSRLKRQAVLQGFLTWFSFPPLIIWTATIPELPLVSRKETTMLKFMSEYKPVSMFQFLSSMPHLFQIHTLSWSWLHTPNLFHLYSLIQFQLLDLFWFQSP